ncbi:hypothetical protein [Stenotrophomonas sp. Marseille-Q4652]|uniref:hypothetical protein n=1 Tax=Stenotrophomonas sp. Marseille-Q4652 TaxID=2866595 RepID=UPI001CE3DAB3|nr:hypothetical protein [Stenotrophomonas sp. Marseille-Q4652]
MHAQPRLEPDRSLAIARTRERLRAHYLRHRNSPPFWDAYQHLQDELAASFPDDPVGACNLMARIAETLGAVPRAQLLDRPDESC